MSEPYWVPMGGAGVPGPQGPTGPAGPTGAQGPATRASLGATAQGVSDWNTAVENGWYYSTPGAANAPEATAYYLGEVITPTGTAWVDQTVWAYQQGVYRWRYRRQRGAGAPGAWGAWVSDPITYRGVYAAGTNYGSGDVVTYAGRYWMSIANNVNVTPS